MDSLAAWIFNDGRDLEFEVNERCKFAFYARQEIPHLLAEKTKLTYHLKNMKAEKAKPELDCYLG